MSLLEISDLHADVAGTSILKGLDLVINAGEVHAIMGPNGSGKSTLSNVVAGKPGYTVTKGDVRLNGKSILEMEVEERAQAGIFLAFQYPVEIPGVSNMEFLKASVDSLAAARGEEQLSAAAFMKRIRSIAGELSLDTDFLKRGVNEGFSGGEKKRNEIVLLLALDASLALLDETDSGLDIDALQVVARGVNSYLREDRAVLMITHYQRLLDYIKPDFVHVLSDGKIIRSGDASLALELEAKGYGWLSE